MKMLKFIFCRLLDSFIFFFSPLFIIFSFSFSLFFYAAACAPLTISIISRVIFAWRRRLYVLLSFFFRSEALSEALFIAFMRAASSLASDSCSYMDSGRDSCTRASSDHAHEHAMDSCVPEYAVPRWA